jgi:hypothetical protein
MATTNFETETASTNPIIYLRFLFQPQQDETPVDDFICQVESAYPGLGVPVLYGLLSILANKSVFYIGGRGVGKTRIIQCTPDVDDYDTSKWDTFTMGELSDLCKRLSNNADPIEFEGIHDNQLVFKVKDFSTLSEYHRWTFLTICSKIISDGDYTHITIVTPYLKFENCKLAMLVAIQPILYSHLCNRDTQWESMSTDRFTKFLVLNPLRQGRKEG